MQTTKNEDQSQHQLQTTHNNAQRLGTQMNTVNADLNVQ